MILAGTMGLIVGFFLRFIKQFLAVSSQERLQPLLRHFRPAPADLSGTGPGARTFPALDVHIRDLYMKRKAAGE